MKIKTLEYIHNLLVEKERKTDEVYREAKRLQLEYEVAGKDKELIDHQARVAKGYMEEHIAALKALEDLEGHNW